MAKKLSDMIQEEKAQTLRSFTRGNELEELDRLRDTINELKHNSVHRIALQDVELGERIRKDLGEIDELAESIKNNGLINPITVQENKKGKYKIIAGGRRFSAYKLLHEKHGEEFARIPSLILNAEILDSFDLEISENLARKNFNDMEFAEALAERKLMYESLNPETKHGGKRPKQMSDSATSKKKPDRFTLNTAKKLGCGETKVKEFLRLNKLDEDLKDKLRSGECSRNEALNEQSARDKESSKGNADSKKHKSKKIIKIQKDWGYYSINSEERNIRISVKDSGLQDKIQHFLDSLEDR